MIEWWIVLPVIEKALIVSASAATAMLVVAIAMFVLVIATRRIALASHRLAEKLAEPELNRRNNRKKIMEQATDKEKAFFKKLDVAGRDGVEASDLDDRDGNRAMEDRLEHEKIIVLVGKGHQYWHFAPDL